MYVFVGGEAAVQFGAGELEDAVQVVGGLPVRVDHLAEHLLVVVEHVAAGDRDAIFRHSRRYSCEIFRSKISVSEISAIFTIFFYSILLLSQTV